MLGSRTILLKLFGLGLILIALAAVLPFLPFAPLKSETELRLSRMLGRKVTVQSVRLNIIGGPYLTLTGMTAEESPEFGSGAFLQAEQVRADLGIIGSLRSRQLFIDALSLKSPKINLVKNAAGVWSWATLGNQTTEETASMTRSLLLSLLAPAYLSKATLKSVRIENGSATLTDRTAAQSQETLYRKIDLAARLVPAAAGNRTQGNLTVRSEEDGEAELLKADLPFDLEIGASASTVSVSGSVGPGPIETKNLSIGAFLLNGEFAAQRAEQLRGSGKMSAVDMFINTVNISEQVAHALKMNQIGDMTPGTRVASLETNFQLSRGVVNTNALQIRQLDGLGDANAQSGSFKIDSALKVNYAAAVTLSADATSKVKSASPMLGLLVTILETNNQLSVPISINGDVRNPEIQVDVSRIF